MMGYKIIHYVHLSLLQVFALLLLTCSTSNAQNTWNWVSQKPFDKIKLYGVKYMNNKIYTFSNSTLEGNMGKYWAFNFLQYDTEGNILFDSTIGENYGETTFNPLYKLRFHKEEIILNLEIFPRFSLPENHFYVLDTNYNTKIKVEVSAYSGDTIGVVTCFNKVNNHYVLIVRQSNSNDSYSANKVRIYDSTGVLIDVKPINIPGEKTVFYNMHYYNNHYYLIGNQVLHYVNKSLSRLIVLKTDSNFQTTTLIQTPRREWSDNFSSAVYPNGDFVIGGTYVDEWVDEDDNWERKYVRRYDKDLNEVWTTYFGQRNYNTRIFDLMINNEDDIVGVGTDGLDEDTIGLHLTGCMFKLTKDGQFLWLRNYQGINNPVNGDINVLHRLDQIPNGGYIATGTAMNYYPFAERGWLIRVNEEGCLTPECVNNVREIDHVAEFLVYPNPSSSSFSITDRAAIRKLEVYSQTGQKMHLPERWSSIEVNTWPAGVYYLTIITRDQQIIHRKFIKP